MGKNVKTDAAAWLAYPHHRWVFNKLDLSIQLGYRAGPCGVSVPVAGQYIVRPIYNLSGMGVSARRVYLSPADYHIVKPGEFWVEEFTGPQISVDYVWVDEKLEVFFASQGFRTSSEFHRFDAWKQIDPPAIDLPNWLSALADVEQINIEFIGDKIIEIHLRSGVADFPVGATEIIPVWTDTEQEQHKFMNSQVEWTWHEDADDADGHLEHGRAGFYYR